MTYDIICDKPITVTSNVEVVERASEGGAARPLDGGVQGDR